MRCRTKNEKLRNDYRARLCENLACTLGKAYVYQSPKTLRDQLRNQRRIKHAIKPDRKVSLLFTRYARFMRQAMVHIPNDSVVLDWAGSRKALGDRPYLRRARKGLEDGVQLPYKSGKEALADGTTVELGVGGMSPGKIRDELKAQGLPARSREGIRKRLKSISIKVSGSPPRRSQAAE